MSPPIRRGGTRIHHGTPATPGQLPYMAYIEATKDSGERWGCCGSLITRTAVLADAFCVHGSTNYTVRLGSIYRAGYDENRWTAESTWGLVHHYYSDKKWDYNIAIIYLPRESPLNEFIQLVDLASPDAGSFIGSFGIVSGWGYIYPGSGMSNVLRWAKLEVIPNDICEEEYGNAVAMYSGRQLCAGTCTVSFDTQL